MALSSSWSTAQDLTGSLAKRDARSIWLFGMRRSGNHALVEWIRRNANCPTAHVNNVFFDERTTWVPNLREVRYIADRSSGRPLDQSAVVWGMRSFSTHRTLGGTGVYFSDAGGSLERSRYLFEDADTDLDPGSAATIAAGRLTHEISQWSSDHAAERTLTIYSVEDRLLDGPALTLLLNGDAKRVILVRDPANWLASRVRLRMSTDNDTIDAYLTLVRAAFEEQVTVGVNYLAWAHSEPYRAALGEALGLTDTARLPLMAVPEFAGGSSFDARAFDGRATEMQVDSRHLHPDVSAQVKGLMDRHRELHEVKRRLQDELERWDRQASKDD